MGEPVRVGIGACRCPGTPHPEGDWAELVPHVTVPMGVAAIVAIREAPADTAAVEAVIAGVFLHHGVRAWSCLDEDGAPVPVTVATIDERLDWVSAYPLVERANELYATELFRPLGLAPSSSSPPGPTAQPTSATNDTGRTRPKRSARSSPAATGSKPFVVPAP